MSRAKNAVASAVNFVDRHKVTIAIVTTAAATAVIAKKVMGSQLEAATEFMKEEGILDKFYATFEDEI